MGRNKEQSSGDDMNYILSGKGKAICDGVEEKLSAGMMHKQGIGA